MIEQDQVFKKCAWRLIPFIMLLYVFSIIDRTNAGFAALTMNKDLGFSPSVFGFGAGLLFITYDLCQVPATVLLKRFGARRIIFCIMAVWGLLAASNAFVQGRQSFYAVRLLLGIAEAGFFPGMIFYLTLWFPQAYRGRYCGAFSTGIPLAGVIGGPLSGVILGMDGLAGIHGWQWLFLVEGLPAALLALAVLKFLPDGPRHAIWLNDAEKEAVATRLAAETVIQDRGLWPALRDPRVLALGVAGFFNGCAVFSLLLWLPQIIQTMGFSNRATGFISAVPYIAGTGAMIFWGRSSDTRRERIWHIALANLFVAVCFASASLAQNNMITLAALTCATMGVFAVFGPYYSLPSSFLSGTAAAGGIALANAICTMGGFVGPYVIGFLKEQTGGFAAALAVLALGEVLGALIILAVGRVLVSRPTIVQPAE